MRQRILRRSARHHDLVGILLAKLAQREGAALGDVGGGADRVGEGFEAALHLLRGLEIAVGEALAAEAELVDGAMFADRGHHVLEHALVGAVVEHVAGGEGAQAMAAGERVQRVQPPRLARAAAVGEREMAARPKMSAIWASAMSATRSASSGTRAATSPSDQAATSSQCRKHWPFSPFLRSALLLPMVSRRVRRDQAARSSGQTSKRAAVHQVEPAAGDEPHAGFPLRPSALTRPPTVLRSVTPSAWIAKHPGRGEQRLRARNAAQEAEMGRGLKLDIGHANRPCRCQLRSPVAHPRRRPGGRARSGRRLPPRPGNNRGRRPFPPHAATIRHRRARGRRRRRRDRACRAI